MSFEAFHFVRPMWLFAFIPAVFILYGLIRKKYAFSAWNNIVDMQLLEYLMQRERTAKHSNVPWVLLFVAWSLAIIALAGPTWSKLETPVFRAPLTRIILLDLSRSMDATDISPTRLTRAKHKVLDLLKLNQEGQTGLIVYAGEPFVVSPLTEDSATITAMVPTLNTEILPVQGTRLDLALSRARQLFDQSGVTAGGVIVVTDGYDDVNSVSIAKELAQLGHRVSVLGIGTQKGAPIPNLSGGFFKNELGGIVIPKLDERQLVELAQSGGGIYAAMKNDSSDVEKLSKTISQGNLAQALERSQRSTEIWEEKGPWLVLVLLPMAAFVFRRGWLLTIMFTFLIILPQRSDAISWDDLWKTKDQQGASALDKGNVEEAANLFSDPLWQGVAHYRAQQFEQAIEKFARIDNVDAHYNRGNALAKLGKLQEAASAYEAALKKDANHEDALYNKKIIDELLKKSQESQQQGKSDQSEQGDQDEQNKQKGQSSQNDAQSQEEQESQSSSDEQQNVDEQKNRGLENQTKENSKQNENNQSQATESQQDVSQEEKSGQSQTQDKQVDADQNDQKQDLENVAEQSNNQQSLSGDKETVQAVEQWLGKIPDDPGGLLREKFRLQYLQQRDKAIKSRQQW